LWLPPQRTSIPAIPPEVKSQFAEIVVVVQAELMRCTAVQQVGMLQLGTDWSVVGSCQKVDLVHAQQSLGLVKQAMLSAAEQSNSIYIIGYEASPFYALPTGVGFSAQLAMVEDDASACWDLLATGHCRRGCNCRWQHPKWQVSLNVVMKCT
jgi:hypothetical protein